MFLKQNICWVIAIWAKFISVLILVSTVRMLSGRQFEQLTIIISIAQIQLILQLNRLRTAVDQLTRKIIIARTLLSNNKIVSSRFFEQTNFEQLIMSLFIVYFLRLLTYRRKQKINNFLADWLPDKINKTFTFGRNPSIIFYKHFRRLFLNN